MSTRSVSIPPEVLFQYIKEDGNIIIKKKKKERGNVLEIVCFTYNASNSQQPAVCSGASVVVERNSFKPDKPVRPKSMLTGDVHITEQD